MPTKSPFYKNICLATCHKHLANIVMMGVGEPLLNYNEVIRGVQHITDKTKLGFSPGCITLSTAGIANKLSG